jgi:anti-sigma regulatory factor (Ser/Thr protein kinase)
MSHAIVIEAKLEHLSTIRKFIEDSTAALNQPAVWVDDLVLAIDELATNIIRHGYRGQPGEIEIEITPLANAIKIRLRDQASPFDPTRIPPADVKLPLKRRPVGGLGVHLARQLVDEFSYQQMNQGGNELTLIKKTNSFP